ncbi:carbamoyl transferase [bacterium]|nr:carbamoyl transferase [bacterium]
MIVLGMSGGTSLGNQDGAAALIIDGRLVAAAEEERFVGIKFANGHLPASAIRFCLRQAGIRIQDVDAAVFAGRTYVDIETTLRRFFEQNLGYAPPLRLVDHHEAHAASAWYADGARDAIVVTWDNSGDGRSTTVWDATNRTMTLLADFHRPNSVGLYYSAVTQFLGFTRDSDEYKVMGMAAYGKPSFDFSHILEIREGGYQFHSDFLTGIVPGRPQPSKHVCLFDEFPLPVPRRVAGSPFEQVHFDVAASAQSQLEEVAKSLVGYWAQKTGRRRVCFAGGVALNCLMNQRIRELPDIDEVFVPPICSDAGLALGAAYLVSAAEGHFPEPLAHAYWGPEYTSAQIKETLDRAAAEYRTTTDPAEAAASLIAEGKIIGWFQGRMEFGPRALGCRSILANPKVHGMKDQINQRIKFREEYRPLAPSVIHDRGAEFFRDYRNSPFMTQTFDAIAGLAEIAPDVVHADGTSRIQSVHDSTNPLYAKLIHEVEKKTGLPIVLNTSLNAYNDPIASAPYQALRTYFSTGLDALVIGDMVLEKRRRT